MLLSTAVGDIASYAAVNSTLSASGFPVMTSNSTSGFVHATAPQSDSFVTTYTGALSSSGSSEICTGCGAKGPS